MATLAVVPILHLCAVKSTKTNRYSIHFLVGVFPGQSLSDDINVDLFVTLSPLTLDKPVQLAMTFHNGILCFLQCKVAGIQLKISFMRKLACTRNVESI